MPEKMNKKTTVYSDALMVFLLLIIGLLLFLE